MKMQAERAGLKAKEEPNVMLMGHPHPTHPLCQLHGLLLLFRDASEYVRCRPNVLYRDCRVSLFIFGHPELTIHRSIREERGGRVLMSIVVSHEKPAMHRIYFRFENFEFMLRQAIVTIKKKTWLEWNLDLRISTTVWLAEHYIIQSILILTYNIWLSLLLSLLPPHCII